MVRANKSMLPKAAKIKKNKYDTAVYHDIINIYYDKFAKEIGIPSDILNKESNYKDKSKSKLKFNLSTGTPIGDYMRKWVKNNLDKAVKFLSRANREMKSGKGSNKVFTPGDSKAKYGGISIAGMKKFKFDGF